VHERRIAILTTGGAIEKTYNESILAPVELPFP